MSPGGLKIVHSLGGMESEMRAKMANYYSQAPKLLVI